MTTQSAEATTDSPNIRSLIPARIDRLPWSRFHNRLVIALGVAWILDGLEITIASNVGPDLTLHNTLNLGAGQVGDIAWWYLIGEVIGALFFGHLSDKLGRKNLFTITLGVYLIGSGLTAATPAGGHWIIFLYATRVLAGMGIGGEYAAINSAIDELIPARYRGRVDLIVNGSFWLGAAAGSGASLLFLDPHILPADLGWRFGFAIGGFLGLGILLLRGYVPESPRWLVIHGWKQEADAAIENIEQRIRSESAAPLAPSLGSITVHPRRSFGLGLIMSAMLGSYRSRSLLALTLMTAQAFLFNAVFFSYGLVLSTFHGVPERTTGIYLLPLAVSNFLGPVLLAPLFDIVGRRKMIAGTYGASGLLLSLTALLLGFDAFTAWTQTIAWMVVFFFASAAASSAYLQIPVHRGQ